MIDLWEVPVGDLAGFESRTFTWDDASSEPTVRHEVLELGVGPSVVLLHELPGLSDETLDFARRLVAEGFRVHVPVLYGRPGQSSVLGGTVRAMWCLRRELDLFHIDRFRPLSRWLQALVHDVASPGHPKVGVIGMCMTGNLAIAAMAEARTGLAVASQPSLPVRLSVGPAKGKADLGVLPQTLRDAKRGEVPLLALRYDRDPICPRERFERLEEELAGDDAPVVEDLGDGVTSRRWERLELVTVDGSAHSVLVADPSEPAIERTIVRLHAELDA